MIKISLITFKNPEQRENKHVFAIEIPLILNIDIDEDLLSLVIPNVQLDEDNVKHNAYPIIFYSHLNSEKFILTSKNERLNRMLKESSESIGSEKIAISIEFTIPDRTNNIMKVYSVYGKSHSDAMYTVDVSDDIKLIRTK